MTTLYTEHCSKLHKLGCWDPSMITHSVMCGHRDPRLPKSGKLECRSKEDQMDLYKAIDYFHQERRPLTLCEMATPIFKYYQDVDVLLPHVKSLQEISEIEALWMECLIRCQAAVLGVIWRSTDALGVERAAESTTVNVFASSGYAKRYGKFKISLHFVWEELHVSAHESKAIRNANLKFVNSEQCGPLHRLLDNAFKGEDPTLDGSKDPWEDILDKASSEGSSLRMPFVDKAIKVDKKAPYQKAANTNEVMEGRPKLPVACYRVQMVGADPGKCGIKPVALAKDYTNIEWIQKGSVRLSADATVSSVWLPSVLMPEPNKSIVVQNVRRSKGEGGFDEWQGQGDKFDKRKKTFRGSHSKTRRVKPKARDETSWISDNLRGYWMDDFDNVLNVWVEATSGVIKVYRGNSTIQIGTISVVDANEYPIKLYFSEERSRHLWVLEYKGDNDLQGTWKANDPHNQSDWNWRRPAVFKKVAWPEWGAKVLLNTAGSVDGPNRVISLGVVLHAVGGQPQNPPTKPMWQGSMKLQAEDLPEGGEITVPMACLGAAGLGLRVCLDLGLQDKEIVIGTDHSIVAAQFANNNRKVAADLRPIVDMIEEYRRRFSFPVQATQTTSGTETNQATVIAKQCRTNGYGTVGDNRLREATCGAIEARGAPGGLNALKQMSAAPQQPQQNYAPPPQQQYPAQGGQMIEDYNRQMQGGPQGGQQPMGGPKGGQYALPQYPQGGEQQPGGAQKGAEMYGGQYGGQQPYGAYGQQPYGGQAYGGEQYPGQFGAAGAYSAPPFPPSFPGEGLAPPNIPPPR